MTHCIAPDSAQKRLGGVYCKCVANQPSKVHKVTSVATVKGKVGTVIWEPMTISKYRGLKASTTVTLTHTTTTDDKKGLQTFVAVVVAGGIAWWAAGELDSYPICIFSNKVGVNMLCYSGDRKCGSNCVHKAAEGVTRRREGRR